MTDGNPIKTCREEELRAYFDRFIPTSRVEFLARAAGADTEDASLDLGYFKIPLPASLIRYFGRSYLNRAAARRWLQPRAPWLVAADISRVQRDLGLDD